MSQPFTTEKAMDEAWNSLSVDQKNKVDEACKSVPTLGTKETAKLFLKSLPDYPEDERVGFLSMLKDTKETDGFREMFTLFLLKELLP